MPKTAEKTIVTDDELAALVLARGGAWPAPLPTVAATDRSLTEAARRGIRSLGVRELLGELDDRTAGGKAPGGASVGTIVGGALASRLDVFAYRADSSAVGVPNGPSLAIFAPSSAGGPCVIDVATGRGVHSLEEVPAETATLLIARAVEDALAQGVDDEDGGTEPGTNVVIVVVKSGAEDEVWQLRKGSAEQGRLEAAHDGLRFVATTQNSSFSWKPAFA